MLVKFRCKRSGNVVSFSNENDIAGLRKHEGYEEVLESPANIQVDLPPTSSKETKQRGRPRKELRED